MRKQKRSGTLEEAIAAIERREIEQWEATTAAYQSTEMSVDQREAEAYRLDTDHRDTGVMPTRSLSFVTPNWNDSLTEIEMLKHCDKIRKVITPESVDPRFPAPTARETLAGISDLLCFSFSTKIKQHIVTLTAMTEAVEGACRHCFGLYHENSKIGDIAIPMLFWFTLADIITTAHVFDAFLSRAWHLTPSSKHFPTTYNPIAFEARYHHERLSAAPMSTPYQMLKSLDENAKKIQYALRHTNDPKEIAKLTHAHVKVLGAMTVLRQRIEHETH